MKIILFVSCYDINAGTESGCLLYVLSMRLLRFTV